MYKMKNIKYKKSKLNDHFIHSLFLLEGMFPVHFYYIVLHCKTLYSTVECYVVECYIAVYYTVVYYVVVHYVVVLYFYGRK